MNGKHSLLVLIAAIAAIFYFGGFGSDSKPSAASADTCMRACGYGMVDRVTSRGECICRNRR